MIHSCVLRLQNANAFAHLYLFSTSLHMRSLQSSLLSLVVSTACEAAGHKYCFIGFASWPCNVSRIVDHQDNFICFYPTICRLLRLLELSGAGLNTSSMPGHCMRRLVHFQQLTYPATLPNARLRTHRFQVPTRKRQGSDWDIHITDESRQAQPAQPVQQGQQAQQAAQDVVGAHEGAAWHDFMSDFAHVRRK
ncbi:hypothetical protein K466DRAFT_615674 [Polyporus arcularius HHB13444]|uniref:Uncharacterized protein n=1 Tax=Polyporus arcularius HHB13444 TaxID=1314778 RepID=A0A5C3NKG5_9APHY|nr:hypothetical protein K466DRAFT_615674 [Polyporus arcularius HHB13444]